MENINFEQEPLQLCRWTIFVFSSWSKIFLNSESISIHFYKKISCHYFRIWKIEEDKKIWKSKTQYLSLKKICFVKFHFENFFFSINFYQGQPLSEITIWASPIMITDQKLTFLNESCMPPILLTLMNVVLHKTFHTSPFLLRPAALPGFLTVTAD